MAATQDLEASIGEAAERVGKSVVRIGRGFGRGAGLVIGDGLVLTNAHNLRGLETTVAFADGRSATGRVRGIDAEGDLVVLEVETGDAPAVSPGSGASPRLGQAVLTVTNPGGLGVRVTAGRVSAVGRAFAGPHGRRISGAVEHAAPLGRGSSGGPLVAADGQLVGVNTHRLGDGFYLAIPADETFAKRVADLAAGKSAQHLRLGVGLAPAEAARRLRKAVGLDARDGVLVRQVEPGSAAERAGVKEGDLIVRAGDHAVASADDLFEALSGLEWGASIVISIVRGAEELEVTASWEAPAEGEGDDPATAGE